MVGSMVACRIGKALVEVVVVGDLVAAAAVVGLVVVAFVHALLADLLVVV